MKNYYCRKCGAKNIVTTSESTRTFRLWTQAFSTGHPKSYKFDPRDGKRVITEKQKCPNNKWYNLGHDNIEIARN